MNCAVIVETRLQSNLIEVICNHMKFLPDWQLIVFGSEKNEAQIKLSFPNCIFVNIGMIDKFDSHKYNRLLTDKDFWKLLIKFEKTLIFQYDSMILRGGVDEFLSYDFIGAPLYHIPFPAMNGGLSIRTTQKMLDICATVKYVESKHGNEDIFFCNQLVKMDGKFPSKETAMKFSVETIFYHKPFGIHAANKWMNESQMKIILKSANE